MSRVVGRRWSVTGISSPRFDRNAQGQVMVLVSEEVTELVLNRVR
jgi:hypothetical protein